MKSIARENYLKTIFELQEVEKMPIVPVGQLAAALGLTPGTVTGMIKKLAGEGLLEYRAYAGCSLTPKGREGAVDIVRRHRILELFLVRTLGLDWAEVHEEAERLEHAVSPRVMEGLDRLLDYPALDPHGDPIPTKEGVIAQLPHRRLSECAEGESCLVARVLDESPEFLRFVGSIGLYPGTAITVRKVQAEAGVIQVSRGEGAPLPLGFQPAAKLLVGPVSSE